MSATKYFRGHVEGGAKHSFSELLIVEQLGKPKVCNLDFPVVDENIGKFEISMHDFVFHESFKSIEHLDEELNGFVLAQSFLFLKVSHEISFVAILQDQVEIIGCFLDVVELNDVSIVTGLQHFYLILEQFHEFPCNSYD